MSGGRRPRAGGRRYVKSSSGGEVGSALQAAAASSFAKEKGNDGGGGGGGGGGVGVDANPLKKAALAVDGTIGSSLRRAASDVSSVAAESVPRDGGGGDDDVGSTLQAAAVMVKREERRSSAVGRTLRAASAEVESATTATIAQPQQPQQPQQQPSRPDVARAADTLARSVRPSAATVVSSRNVVEKAAAEEEEEEDGGGGEKQKQRRKERKKKKKQEEEREQRRRRRRRVLEDINEWESGGEAADRESLAVRTQRRGLEGALSAQAEARASRIRLALNFPIHADALDPFLWAAFRGDVRELQRLAKTEGYDAKTLLGQTHRQDGGFPLADGCGRTAAHYAAFAGRVAVLRWLALTWRAELVGAHRKQLRELRRRRSDFLAECRDDMQFLEETRLAQRSSSPSSSRKLQKKIAALEEDVEMFEEWLAEEVDRLARHLEVQCEKYWRRMIGSRDADERTPLQYAVMSRGEPGDPGACDPQTTVEALLNSPGRAQLAACSPSLPPTSAKQLSAQKRERVRILSRQLMKDDGSGGEDTVLHGFDVAYIAWEAAPTAAGGSDGPSREIGAHSNCVGHGSGKGAVALKEYEQILARDPLFPAGHHFDSARAAFPASFRERARQKLLDKASDGGADFSSNAWRKQALSTLLGGSGGAGGGDGNSNSTAAGRHSELSAGTVMGMSLEQQEREAWARARDLRQVRGRLRTAAFAVAKRAVAATTAGADSAKRGKKREASTIKREARTFLMSAFERHGTPGDVTVRGNELAEAIAEILGDAKKANEEAGDDDGAEREQWATTSSRMFDWVRTLCERFGQRSVGSDSRQSRGWGDENEERRWEVDYVAMTSHVVDYDENRNGGVVVGDDGAPRAQAIGHAQLAGVLGGLVHEVAGSLQRAARIEAKERYRTQRNKRNTAGDGARHDHFKDSDGLVQAKNLSWLRFAERVELKSARTSYDDRRMSTAARRKKAERSLREQGKCRLYHGNRARRSEFINALRGLSEATIDESTITGIAVRLERLAESEVVMIHSSDEDDEDGDSDGKDDGYASSEGKRRERRHGSDDSDDYSSDYDDRYGRRNHGRNAVKTGRRRRRHGGGRHDDSDSDGGGRRGRRGGGDRKRKSTRRSENRRRKAQDRWVGGVDLLVDFMQAEYGMAQRRELEKAADMWEFEPEEESADDGVDSEDNDDDGNLESDILDSLDAQKASRRRRRRKAGGDDSMLRRSAPALMGGSRPAVPAGFTDRANIRAERVALINAADSQSCTALHFAASSGRLGALKVLLKSGASRQAKNRNGLTPLAMCRDRIVRRLLMLGALDQFTDAEFRRQQRRLQQIRCPGGGDRGTGFDDDDDFESNEEESDDDDDESGDGGGEGGGSRKMSELGSALATLADGGGDPNERQGSLSQSVPLHLACMAGEPRATVTLLQRGALPDIADANGWTPLHHCASRGGTRRRQAARALLEAEANPNARTGRGRTPLHLAVCRTSPSTSGSYPRDRVDPSLLHLLFEAGADVDARDESGATPLHVASEAGAVRGVLALLYRGAGVFTTSDRGWNALHFAVAGRTSAAGGGGGGGGDGSLGCFSKMAGSTIRLLSQWDSESRRLRRTRDSQGKTPAELSPNAAVASEMTNLWEAARDANIELLLTLIHSGMDAADACPLFVMWHPAHVESKTVRRGYTALHLAVIGCGETVSELRRKYNGGAGSGFTVLGRRDLKAPASRARRDKAIAGAEARSLRAVRVLLDNHAYCDSLDRRCMTPLMYAARHDLAAIVAELLKEGADLNASDLAGNTALHYAYAFGRMGIASTLKAAGAKEDAVNHRKDNPDDVMGRCERIMPPVPQGNQYVARIDGGGDSEDASSSSEEKDEGSDEDDDDTYSEDS